MCTIERLLSYPEAWKLLGVSRPTFARIVGRGELPVVVVSKGRKLIDPADLRAFIEARRTFLSDDAADGTGLTVPEDDEGPVGAEPSVEEIADDARARTST